jgi:choline kinase
MQVVILNSGIGKRLGSLTEEQPKCLVSIAEQETILSRQLKTLENFDVEDIFITTGPFQNLIKGAIEKFKHLPIRLIHNPDFATSNYIYSLFLLKPHLNQDILLIHGDLVFEKIILSNTINAPHSNVVVVNNVGSPNPKDFNAVLSGDRVTSISTKSRSEAVSLYPIYKLCAADFQSWMNGIYKLIDKGQKNVYAEDALNPLLNNIHLHALHQNSFCSEVDDLEDLLVVKKYLSASK